MRSVYVKCNAVDACVDRRRISNVRRFFRFCLTQSIIFLACFLLNGARAEDQVHLITAELAPYSFMRGDRAVGVCYDLVMEMAKRVGYSGGIEFIPWARAQQMVQDDPSAILVQQSRSPERERQYRWIAPLLTDQWLFAGRGDIALASSEGLKPLKIGVIRSSATERYLREHKFFDIDTAETDEINARKLMAGRIEAWLGYRLMIRQAMRNVGFDPNRIVYGPSLRNIEIYFAGNPAIPESEARRWFNALSAMRIDGTYEKIVALYR
ncbi:putative Amino acid ABC transporter substrate-binding protein [Azospirillaceae bacterium]